MDTKDETSMSSISSSMSTTRIEHQLDSQLLDTLGLDDSADSNIIIAYIKTKGRQGLTIFVDDIARAAYAEQMEGESQLLNILKQYFEQQWYSMNHEWLVTFLNQQKQESPELYEKILTRTAEYGTEYMKESPSLSLIIQFMFEFDGEMLEYKQVFDEIWKYLISFGCKGLEKYSDYFARALLEEQMENSNSPLRMALQEYYREPLRNLMNGNNIREYRNLTSIALNCIVSDGWWNGLNDTRVQDLISRNRFNTFRNSIKNYLTMNKLIIPDNTTVTNNNDTSHLQPELYPISPIITVVTQPTVTLPEISPPSQTSAVPELNQSSSFLQNSNQSNCSIVEPMIPPSISLPNVTHLSLLRDNSKCIEERSSLPLSTASDENEKNVCTPFKPSFTQEQIMESKVLVSDDQNAEIYMVSSCFIDEQKYELSKLVQAGELLYAGKKYDEILTTIVNNFRATNDFSLFIEACLEPIMYLIKRHQNLDDFVEALSTKLRRLLGSDALTVIQLSMRMLIHILLLKSDLALSRMIMCLLCERNPVPFIEPTLTQTQQSSYKIVPEIIHVWNYDVPTLLSFGIGPHKGKSSLLNKIFMSTFEESSNSIYFQQTIDIDFGYNFQPRRTLNIADAHGEITVPLFNKIQGLFTGFLVHIDYKYLNENDKLVRSFIRTLPSGKFSLLIIHNVHPDSIEQCSNYITNASIKTKPLLSINYGNTKESKGLIRELRDLIFNENLFKSSYDKTFVKNLLSSVISDDYKQHLINMNGTIGTLKRKLIQLAEHNSQLAEFYPKYVNFVQLCKAQQKLLKLNFYGDNDSAIDDTRQEILQRRQKQNEMIDDSGIIFELFNEILKLPNMLMCLNMLARDLKEERNRFVSKSELAKQVPIERSFSLELLWRNATLCSRFETNEIEGLILRKYLEYINAGLPFEIIDGDNYHFPHEFLSKILSNKYAPHFTNKRVLVISIIGPQNSGKSTLLNYMFGTFFDVRDGRCTRGIYGSFMKSNRREFDYIMLIDTEGLLGVEQEDREFDRRLVLFCLAVSHLVIVNMVGEINDSLRAMLTLCTDSLREMGVSRVPQPVVHFVLNQKADPNIENNKAAIERIISDLSTLDLNKMINISQETFHTLPNAFKKDRGLLNDNNFPCLIRTEPDFMIEMESKQQNLKNELENHLRVSRASEAIRTRSRQFLKVQIIEIFNALRIQCQMTSEQAHIHLLVQNGEGELQKRIDDIIARGTFMSKESALKEFDLLFNTIINPIEQNFNHPERMRMALKHIYTEYQIYEKECIPDYQNYTLNHLSWLQRYQNNDIPENDILDSLHTLFSTLAYRYPLVESCPYDSDLTDLYSSKVIENLVYLNKDLIKQRFGDILRTNSVSEPSRKSLTIRQQVAKVFSRNFTDAKQETYAMVCDEFLYTTRQVIINECSKMSTILTNTCKEERYLHVQASKLIQIVINLIVSATRGNQSNETRRIHSDIIQRIVGQINTLIKEVNLELKPFCLVLNRLLKTTFHTCTIVLLAKYYYNEQHTHFLQTLQTLNDRRSHLETFFIKMVVTHASSDQNNVSDDDNDAINLCERVKEYISAYLNEEGQRVIQNDLKQYENINRKWIQDQCDGKLFTAQDSEWYLDYIEHPTKIVEQHFKDLWSDIRKLINQDLNKLKCFHRDTLSNFFYCIQGMYNIIKDKGRALHLANSIFQVCGNNSLNADQNFNNKRRCISSLLFNYLSEGKIPPVYTCSNNNYKLTMEAQQTFTLVAQQYIPNSKLITITKLMLKDYDSCSVSNLARFLQRILEEQSIIMCKYDEAPYDFETIDTLDTYERLLDKVRGCYDRCPCCQRPCDFDHTKIKSQPGSEDNQHRCATGHALRAMNGYKFEETNEASLFMCEQIENNQIIVVGPQRKRWSEFKIDHSDWIFESLLNQDELNRLYSKFLRIWQIIGPQLCAKYSMEFVSYNTRRNRVVQESFHYVLLLDSSGSMNGQAWQDLLNAVRVFLERRRELHIDDRITIITFTSHANVVFFNETVENIAMNRIPFNGGNTNFSSAFKAANQCIARSKTVDSKFAIIFMSDGQASYPAAELDILSESHGSVLKHFWTLQLGRTQMNILQEINRKMHGTFFNIEESSLLIDAYAEIARTS